MKTSILSALIVLVSGHALANSVDDAFANAKQSQAARENQQRATAESRREALHKSNLIKAAAIIVGRMGTSVAELGIVSLRSNTVKLKTKSGLICQAEFSDSSKDSYTRSDINEQMPHLIALCSKKAASALALVQSHSGFFSGQSLTEDYGDLKYDCGLTMWEARGDCYDSKGKLSYMGLTEFLSNDVGVRGYDHR